MSDGDDWDDDAPGNGGDGGDDNGWDNDGDGDWGDADVVMPDKVVPSAMNTFSDTSASALTRTFSAVVLTKDLIDEAIAKRVAELKDELEIPENHCLLLLRKFKWNIGKIREAYFTDPERMLKESGVCTDPQEPKQKSGDIECQVCMEDVPVNTIYSLECGHQTTCTPCWIDILCDAIKTKECVNLTCPAYKCNVIIPADTYRELLGTKKPNELERYERFRRENFVEFNKEFGFCPGPNCDMVYSATAGVAGQVSCKKCGYNFCWACKQGAHHPSSCHVAEKWNIKCSSEAENISWILAKTKKCPKCGVHIEKNQGCNHMTCRPAAGGCGHEFCWLCKGDWKEHGSSTGGYYQCNIYEKNKAKGVLSAEEKASEDAKNELQRYEFHWTRFDSHAKSYNFAKKSREGTHDKMHELSQTFGWRLNEAQFLLDAVDEAIQCWHVLAWTYPIAYYFDKESHNLDLFKSQQQDLETFCDGLQEKLDFDLTKLGDNKVRHEMIGYTRTAQQYRKNLVEYIENELSF